MQENQAPAEFKELTFPEDIAAWAETNQEMIERVLSALADTYDDVMTEDQLWRLIADNVSPAWQKARAEFEAADEAYEVLNNPENKSLGLIGCALDSHELIPAQDRVTDAFVNFVMIDEGLRQRKELGRLLSVLVVQKKMMTRSAEQTRQLAKVTAGPTAKIFPGVAEKLKQPPKTPAWLTAAFSINAGQKRLLKKADVRKELVPSSPEI